MVAAEIVRQAVFWDRDGVLTRSIVRDGKPFAPVTLQEFEILPGAPEALLKTRQAGFLNIVVTNQPDIATGKQDRHVLDRMHSRLKIELAVDSIWVCTHIDADDCDCRKPKAGLLLNAAREHGVRLTESYMVGDRWRDVAAGQSAGCQSFFIDHGYAEKRPEPPFVTVKSAAEAADLMLFRTTEINKKT